MPRNYATLKTYKNENTVHNEMIPNNKKNKLKTIHIYQS